MFFSKSLEACCGSLMSALILLFLDGATGARLGFSNGMYSCLSMLVMPKHTRRFRVQSIKLFQRSQLALGCHLACMTPCVAVFSASRPHSILARRFVRFYLFTLRFLRNPPAVLPSFMLPCILFLLDFFVQATDDIFWEIRAWGGNLSFKETKVTAANGGNGSTFETVATEPSDRFACPHALPQPSFESRFRGIIRFVLFCNTQTALCEKP